MGLERFFGNKILRKKIVAPNLFTFLYTFQIIPRKKTEKKTLNKFSENFVKRIINFI